MMLRAVIMRGVSLCLCLSVLLVSAIEGLAQNVPDSQAWETVQRCVDELPYPSVPRSQWTFEGVIFSQNSEGIRAIRTDVDTSYFIALDSDTSFAFDGAFSPDGRWFAWPKGSTSYATMVSDLIFVDELQVVSTDPRRASHRIPWRYLTYSGVTRNLPAIFWLDNERFLYHGNYEGDSEVGVGGGTIDPFTGKFQPWNKEAGLYTLFSFSPDFTRALHWDYYGDLLVKLYDVEADTLLRSLETDRLELEMTIAWLPDSSGLIAPVQQHNAEAGSMIWALVLLNRDGKVLEAIAVGKYFGDVAISRDGRKAAFQMESQLFIADLDSRVVTDLCFTMKDNKLAWSPDGVYLAFTYDGYPILLNTDTLEMQILRYETGEIIGWYATD